MFALRRERAVADEIAGPLGADFQIGVAMTELRERLVR
jgi:hypothetical protein